MISPQEFGKITFTRTVRGYEPSEVDECLENLSREYTKIYKQCEIYDEKLKRVLEKISELQERENDIQDKEETISKTMMSSQMIHDKRIKEAQNEAENIVLRAEEAAGKILEDARFRAQTAFEAVTKKTEMQIESAREKSESLYLAAKTRCAKLLGDLKKEIVSQKERMTELKEAADNFNVELSEAYRNQFEAIKSATVYAPPIDFDKLTEARLFNMIMEEIKEDMLEIESKNREVEYEFEKELLILKDFDFAEESLKEYKKESETKSSGKYDLNEEHYEYSENSAESDTAEYEDDDVKVFSGSETLNEQAVDAGESEYEAETAFEEKPISTYDSDDYMTKEETGGYKTGYDDDDDHENHENHENDDENDEDDENGEEDTSGLFGFFKGFGKKKKSRAEWDENLDDPDENYDEPDDSDDDDEVMSIFDGFDEEDDDD